MRAIGGIFGVFGQVHTEGNLITPVPNGIDVVVVEVVLLDDTVLELRHSMLRIKGR